MTLDLSINHLSMSHEFVVVVKLNLNVLIGCNFSYRLNLGIDFVNRTSCFMETRWWERCSISRRN